MTTTTATLKIMGITQDVTDCECCGKTGLKRTVILGRLDADGNVMTVVHYGSRCAALALQTRRTGAAIEKEAEAAQRASEEAATRRVVDVNPEDNDRNVMWVVESIGNNGGSVNRLCFARGTRSAISRWAATEYPTALIDVRVAH